MPTLLLWGDRDTAIAPWVADSSAALCDDVRVVRFPRATHWVAHEDPARVTRLLAEFLTGGPGPAGTGVASLPFAHRPPGGPGRRTTPTTERLP